jgi:ribokinase
MPAIIADMSPRVVVVGSLNLDLVIRLARMPDSGETVFGSTLEQHAGGKGLNQAVAAARLGSSVTMIGALGDDSSGEWLRGIVVAEGIDDSGIATVDGTSGTAVIEVDADGANRIVVISGANGQVTSAHVVESLSMLDDVAVVLSQGEVPVDVIETAMAAGRSRGAITILNPAPVRDYPASLYAHVDYVIPNEHEAAHLTGLPTDTSEDALAAARALVGFGAGCAVITRGGAGAVWATATDSGTSPAFPVSPIDTVAAGDAFCGGLTTALAEGKDLTVALRWASAAGGLATTVAGAVPSLPTRGAVTALVQSGA